MPKTNRRLKLATFVVAALAPLTFGSAAVADPLINLIPLLLPAPPLPPAQPPAQPPAAASPAPASPTPPASPAATPGAPTPLQVEERLDALHFDVGAVDGVFDGDTGDAVMAFQKTLSMERTGKLDDTVAKAIVATVAPPPPLQPGGGANRVEVDLSRQILMVYEGDALSRVLPISSGTEETPTPTGSYKIYRQVTGWETSPLGRLYNSQYFVGGYAIHGSLSVPAHPASHGCVRIPMRAAEWLPDHVGIGTPVYVTGG